jgi:hypothetical protein
MRTVLVVILVLTLSALTPVHWAFAYGGGGGGGGDSVSESTIERGDDKKPPEGYEVMTIPVSTSSVEETDTTVSTKEAIEHLRSLPPEVQEEIEFFWFTATCIYIGYKTGGLSRGAQALIGALLGGGGAALKGVGKDPKDKPSVIRGVVQGAGVSQVPGGPIVQEGVSRLLDKVSLPSLPTPSPGGGVGMGRTLAK